MISLARAKRSRLSRNLVAAVYAALAAGILASCAQHSRPSKAEQTYFDAYSNETRNTIAWWRQQLNTGQLIRTARGGVDTAQSVVLADSATKRDQALRTLREEYGLTDEEVQSVINGQTSRRIEQELSRGRKRLEVRIDRLEKIFAQSCKDFQKNPTGTVDELKRAENNVEKYLKGG